MYWALITSENTNSSICHLSYQKKERKEISESQR